MNRKPLTLRDWIGVCLIAAFVASIMALFWKIIPKENEQLIVYMLGQLSGFVATVVGFHYVVSKNDEQKSENTAAAFRAIEATAKNGTGATDQNVIRPGDTVELREPQP
ncbi:MAG: hypothetical protein JWQ03_3102 [Variovorax sp.]|nr:hypothetical protein [Variovorax sp.]